MAAVHTDTSSVQVRVTCEFHSYDSASVGHVFIQTVWSKQHRIFTVLI